MQIVSKKVSKKYRDAFRERRGSLKEFAEWSGLKYNRARYFRSQEVIDKADQYLDIIKAKEKEQLSKDI